MTTSTSPIDLSAVQRMDAHVVHPWESFDKPNASRTVLGVGDGAYVFDAKGNRLLDGPGGMWCVNAGHGQQKIVDTGGRVDRFNKRFGNRGTKR